MLPYVERQRENPFFIVAMAAVALLVIIWLWRYFKVKTAGRQVTIAACVGVTLIFIPVFAFLSQQLTVTIDDTGISYSYFSGIFRREHIPFSEIRSVRVATFRPYHYVGSRKNITLKRHNNEYAISGTNGLILHLRDHRRIVLGTRRPHELSQKINELSAQGLLPDLRVF